RERRPRRVLVRARQRAGAGERRLLLCLRRTDHAGRQRVAHDRSPTRHRRRLRPRLRYVGVPLAPSVEPVSHASRLGGTNHAELLGFLAGRPLMPGSTRRAAVLAAIAGVVLVRGDVRAGQSDAPPTLVDRGAFLSPPAALRPAVRWWWPGGDVDDH